MCSKAEAQWEFGKLVNLNFTESVDKMCSDHYYAQYFILVNFLFHIEKSSVWISTLNSNNEGACQITVLITEQI